MRRPLVSSRSTVLFRPLVPAILLGAYAVAWGWTALGRGVPGGDDHPGQLYRLIHAITLGPAPWHWNAGWWAGSGRWEEWQRTELCSGWSCETITHPRFVNATSRVFNITGSDRFHYCGWYDIDGN